MVIEAVSGNAALRNRLETAIRRPPDYGDPMDVVVTTYEVNDRHGTGPLLKRVFKSRNNVYSIRSRDAWGGQDFGKWNARVPQESLERPDWFRNVLSLLAGRRVRNILCVPFMQDELRTSIAIKEAFHAQLCAYIMDDQNVAAELIPDDLMREFLKKCSLRLATHPELRAAYERKYGLPFFILPAVVPDRLIADDPIEPAYDPKEKTGALLGSFWDQSWFDRLCKILERCGRRIDWYGNHQSPWLKFPEQTLQRATIRPFGLIQEEHLAQELRRYPFVIVPAGALDDLEINRGVARLSLPGRILFASATSHTPILVVGSKKTCAARFVKHFGIGETAPYEAAEVARVMERLSDPRAQQAMRRRAAEIGPVFSDRGVVEWLARSIEQGGPADARFEDVFSDYV